jgi:hypothetical protein
MTGLEARNRLRQEAMRLERLVAKEAKRDPRLRRQHVMDGAQVAIHILRKLAIEMASEAQAQELLDLLEAEE